MAELRCPFALVIAFALGGLAGDLLGWLPHRWDAWIYWPSLMTYAAVGLYSGILILIWKRWALRDVNGGWVMSRIAWGRLAKDPMFQLGRVLNAAAAVVLIALVLNVFGAWKLAIGHPHGFAWDQVLYSANSWLHVGRDEWQLLHRILPARAIWFLDTCYYLWLSLVAGGLAYQVWRPPSRARRRFFFSFALTWLGMGALLATLFSSAGPAYYARVTGLPDPYRDLWLALDEVQTRFRLITPGLQDALWSARLAGAGNPYTAISAFPSMHVAIPALFALSLQSVSRWASSFAWVYTTLVLVGSVALGWHYAIDGYASLLGVALIWWASGRWPGCGTRKPSQ